jgi:hypothetical protein
MSELLLDPESKTVPAEATPEKLPAAPRAVVDHQQAAQAAMESATDARARISAMPDATHEHPEAPKGQDPSEIRLHRGLAYMPGEEDPYILAHAGASEKMQRFAYFIAHPDDTSHPSRGVRTLKKAWKAYATVSGARYVVRGMDAANQWLLKKYINKVGVETFKEGWLTHSGKLPKR